ncbi:MAG: TlpA family protein disulfide reductase [SAR324 cluster bacterium]|nr:TlpA family protein disulfide reductase [SAR324 cluster bacterium]
MTHFLTTRVLPLILLSIIFTGCYRNTDLETSKYGSTEDVSRFLKKQYFEVSNVRTSIDDFEYTLLNGKKERFSKNQGKIILLNFWATWCYPCKVEMPDMQTLMNEMEGEHFRILAVNYGEDPAKVKRFIQKTRYTFDIALDSDIRFGEKLKIKGLPTTLIIDKNGQILGKLIGPAKWSKESFLEFFRELSRKQI